LPISIGIAKNSTSDFKLKSLLTSRPESRPACSVDRLAFFLLRRTGIFLFGEAKRKEKYKHFPFFKPFVHFFASPKKRTKKRSLFPNEFFSVCALIST
jgi:hypothetical protein